MKLGVDSLDLSVLPARILRENHIFSIEDLVRLGRRKLCQLKGLGPKSQMEILDALDRVGIKVPLRFCCALSEQAYIDRLCYEYKTKGEK